MMSGIPYCLSNHHEMHDKHQMKFVVMKKRKLVTMDTHTHTEVVIFLQEVSQFTKSQKER